MFDESSWCNNFFHKLSLKKKNNKYNYSIDRIYTWCYDLLWVIQSKSSTLNAGI